MLHSSIDIDLALGSICQESVTGLKVILATNVAESSVTIPSVRHVIDMCLTLQVKWDPDTSQTSTTTVFTSKSQSAQRKGRAGRLRDGVVWRMVPRVLFDQFDEFEAPAIKLLNLADPVLLLLASASPVLSRASALLAECMDPPEPAVVKASLDYLESISAVEAKPGGGAAATASATKYIATVYGRLLVDMPVSLLSARVAVACASQGFLREGAVLAAIQSCCPKPVDRPFGNAYLYHENLKQYMQGAY